MELQPAIEKALLDISGYLEKRDKGWLVHI